MERNEGVRGPFRAEWENSTPRSFAAKRGDAMRIFKAVLLAAMLGCGVFSLVTSPVNAKTTSSIVKKCDKAGKVCTSGKDCKASNCKTR